MARPDQSAVHAKLKSQQTLFLLTFAKTKHYFILFVLVTLGRWLELIR